MLVLFLYKPFLDSGKLILFQLYFSIFRDKRNITDILDFYSSSV